MKIGVQNNAASGASRKFLRKYQSKIKKKQLNTIKRIYKKHSHINDISQEISYDVFREQCTEVQTENTTKTTQPLRLINIYAVFAVIDSIINSLCVF